MTKLSHTSETAIAITFLVMNLSTWLWRLFLDFLCLFCQVHPFSVSVINQNYTLTNHP